MKLVCTRFKNLKVLDMRSVDSHRMPEEIGDLVLLKYLGLMGGETVSMIGEDVEIPPSIGKLKRLQILQGAWNRRYTIPTEICELHELRYLDIRMKGSLNICNHQTKLHTLRSIQYKDWIKIDPVNFTNLHTLFIGEDENDPVEENSVTEDEVVIKDKEVEEGYGYTLEPIANLTSLQTFSLSFHSAFLPAIKPLSSCNRLKSVNLVGTLKDPSKLCFLPYSVMELNLCFSEFTEDPMLTLGSLSNLTALQLIDVYRGNKMVCSHNAFPSLQFLRLYMFPNLVELEVEDGAFPSLKQYKTVGCEKLENIPVQLERFMVK